MPPKKTKFVNINSVDCNSALLPGRHRCECQATKHPLINNCLSCGRIVCAQEGKGPCFWCGELVLTRSERYRVLEGNSKKTQDLVAKYSKLPRPEDDLKKESAMKQKEKLLEFDRTSAQRTKVIDDQSDYFATESPWLSEEEKQVLKKKQEAYKEMKDRLRRKTKITIDFAGRRIIEEVPEMPSMNDFNIYSNSSVQMQRNTSRSYKDNDDGPRTFEEPEFVGQLERKSKSKDTPPAPMWSSRIQDAELQEMVDSGNCLSIQQPYATLVIDGIKQSKPKENEILKALETITAKFAASDEILTKLQAIPETVASQAVLIEQLSSELWNISNSRQERNEGSEGSDTNETNENPPDSLDVPNPFASLLHSHSKEKDTSLDDGSKNTVSEDSAPALELLLKNKPPSSYGGPLDTSVKDIFEQLLDHEHEKKVVEKLKDSYKIPDNCKLLGTPRVNAELWSNLDRQAMSRDWELRGIQDLISLNMIVLAKMVEHIDGSLKESKEPSGRTLMNILGDATTISAFAFQELNTKRRTLIRKILPRDVAAAITSEMKTTELLFGDNFAEKLKSAKSAVSLTKSTFRGQRAHPYNNNKGFQNRERGYSHNYQKDLNFNRPPPQHRGPRGGRWKGPRNHNQYNNNSHSFSQHQNQNQH